MALMTVRSAAQALGVHENTVRNWESRGLLRAIHLRASDNARRLPWRAPWRRHGHLERSG